MTATVKAPSLRSRIRLGQIAYTNCVPYYHQLSGFKSRKAVPAEINQAMSRGEIDIAPVSSLEYLNHAEQYYLLPDFSISARNFSGSVILFSKVKIENLNGVTIALTRESLSSVTLLKILLEFKYKFKNKYQVMDSDPEAMLKKQEAALVIGDDALFFQPKEFVYKYDLAELWWDWTEKPFCFAVWAVRKEFADRYPEEVAAFCGQLKKNLDQNLTNLEALLKEALNLDFLDRKFSKVFGYLFNLNYGLDGEILQGLELFYRFAHRLKASPKLKKIIFFGDGKLHD